MKDSRPGWRSNYQEGHTHTAPRGESVSVMNTRMPTLQSARRDGLAGSCPGARLGSGQGPPIGLGSEDARGAREDPSGGLPRQ